MGLKKQVIFVPPEKAPSFELKGILIDQLLPKEACGQFSAYRVKMRPHQVKKPVITKWVKSFILFWKAPVWLSSMVKNTFYRKVVFSVCLPKPRTSLLPKTILSIY